MCFFYLFKSFLSNILFPHVCIEVIDHHADKYLWFINETVFSVGERFHCAAKSNETRYIGMVMSVNSGT